MTKVRVVLVAMLVLGVLGGAASGARAALPEFSGTLPDAFSVKSGTAEFSNLNGGIAVVCKKGTGNGTVNNTKSASFTELFEECSATVIGIKVTCTGGKAGEKSGDIGVSGSATLGFELGTLVPLEALSLTGTVSFACSSVKTEVKGCVLGSVTLAKGLSGTLTLTGSGGDQKWNDYTSDAGVMTACELLSSVNGAAFVSAEQKQTATLTFAKELGVLD